MTMRADLLALASRCETEEPSAVLDAAIAVAIRRGPEGAPTWLDRNFPNWSVREDGRVEAQPNGVHWAPAAFTSSLDVAMTLVPDGWVLLSLSDLGPTGMFHCQLGQVVSPCLQVSVDGSRTLVLVLVAAALRARAAMVPE